MAPDSHEIRTLDEFSGLVSQPVGFVVVTDEPTSTTRAHRTSCRTITENGFREKVIENGGRNGRYYFFLRLEDASEMLAADSCRICV